MTPNGIGDRLEVGSDFEGQFLMEAMSPVNYAINDCCEDDYESLTASLSGPPIKEAPLSQKNQSSSRRRVTIIETLDYFEDEGIDNQGQQDLLSSDGNKSKASRHLD